MTSATYDLVRQAIADKQQIIAVYGGHIREMCPHAIGLGPKGNEQALFYQFGGTSSKGDASKMSEVEKWRCLPLERLSDVLVQAGDWHTGGNHSVSNTCIATLDLEVAY